MDRIPMKCSASEILDMSTLDYPGMACAVVFMRGCPLTCAYCSNWGAPQRFDDTAQICDRLLRLRNCADAVTITGGEPLAQGRAFRHIASCARRLGYKIGVQTSGCTGTAPRWISLGYIDALMLDLKAVPRRYQEVCGCSPGNTLDTASGASRMRGDGRLERYDTRTTIFRGISDSEGEIKEIAAIASGSDTYTLTQGRADLATPCSRLEEVERDEMLALGRAARLALAGERTRVYVSDRLGKTEITL